MASPLVITEICDVREEALKAITAASAEGCVLKNIEGIADSLQCRLDVACTNADMMVKDRGRSRKRHPKALPPTKASHLSAQHRYSRTRSRTAATSSDIATPSLRRSQTSSYMGWMNARGSTLQTAISSYQGRSPKSKPLKPTPKPSQ